MIYDGLKQQAIALYDDFTPEHRDRRRLIADLTRLAGSNDTAPDRHNAEAANLAWKRTIAFYRRTLG